MHVAPHGFTVSGPQKLLECTVGSVLPNPNPPAGACAALPALLVPPGAGPALLSQREAPGCSWSPSVMRKTESARIPSSLLPSSLPLPTQRRPTRRKSCRLAKRLLSFLLKSPAALAIAAAPEAREQWSLLSSTLPWPSGQLRRLDAPSRVGEWFPRPPPTPSLGLSQGQAPVAWEAGEGRRHHPLFQEKPEAQSWAGSGAGSPPAPEGEGATSAQGPAPHSKGNPAVHPGSECAY